MIVAIAIFLGVVAGVAAGFGAWRLGRWAARAVNRWVTWRGIRRAHRRQRIELRRMRRNRQRRNSAVARS